MAKKKTRSILVEFLMNFAFVFVLIYSIVLIPYAFIKKLFPSLFYLISFILVIAYIIFWIIKHKNDQRYSSI